MEQGRVGRVRERMRSAGVDALVLGPGADFRYMAGYEAHLSERLTALVLPAEGEARIVVPRLEAPGAEASGLPLAVWEEHEQPLDLVAEAVRALGATRIGVGDHLWSRFLLGLQERLPDARWSAASAVLGPVRLIKTPEEIALLRRAGAAADRVWARVVELPLEGMTERAVAGRIAAMLEAEELEGMAFGIVGAGPNGASPHHTASARPLRRGDVVVLDYGGPLEGYHSDLTRTLCVGPADPEQRRVHAAVREAQERAVRAVRPGATAGEVDAAARTCLDVEGLGEFFVHRTGHGLGLELHEPPYILAGSAETLRQGMVFSVEPGAYLPGRFGVRIEDIVVVTEDGCERLNRASRDLAEV